MFNFNLQKKNFLKLIQLIFFVIILGLYLNTYMRNSQTLSNAYNSNKNNQEYDFDGDGENDELSIISTNSTYSIKIKNSLGETLLKSNEFDYSLLDISPSCAIKISYIDLNRNKIPEIIISGLKNNKSTFYIFKWENNSFQEVFFTQNNILSILDFNNSKTPKIYTTSSSKGDEATEGYILNSTTLKDISFSSPKIPSLNSIQLLIDCVEADYELDDAPDIFTSTIESDQLGLLWNLDKSNYRYSFQKAYCYDTTWNEFGNTSSLCWILSFEKINFTSSDSKPKELLLYVTAEIDESNQFKISSIIKK